MNIEYFVNNGQPEREDFERDPRLVLLAQETLSILDNGRYYNRFGHEVVIAPDLRYAVQNTRLYTPEQGQVLLADGRPSGYPITSRNKYYV